LRYPNLTIGIHTVISKYNVNNFSRIYQELNKLNPDSYITEIAEERVELGTIGQKIMPHIEDYSKAIDFLSQRIKEQPYEGISTITQAFRIRYYDLVKKTLKEKRQILPCYAGFISAQIAPDGNVWPCCIKAESMGNLREVNYDFKKVWLSNAAKKLRKPIREKRCFCPLANASYTNMLVSFGTMAGVIKNIAEAKVRKYF
jgi:MoaA/NifB/PqqE/SkfB family radical SAM enzyme